MRAASKHRNSQRMSKENEEPVVSIEEPAQEPAASASKAEAKPKQPKKCSGTTSKMKSAILMEP